MGGRGGRTVRRVRQRLTTAVLLLASLWAALAVSRWLMIVDM
jgi:hypothetical protein